MRILKNLDIEIVLVTLNLLVVAVYELFFDKISLSQLPLTGYKIIDINIWFFFLCLFGFVIYALIRYTWTTLIKYFIQKQKKEELPIGNSILVNVSLLLIVFLIVYPSIVIYSDVSNIEFTKTSYYGVLFYGGFFVFCIYVSDWYYWRFILIQKEFNCIAESEIVFFFRFYTSIFIPTILSVIIIRLDSVNGFDNKYFLAHFFQLDIIGILAFFVYFFWQDNVQTKQIFYKYFKVEKSNEYFEIEHLITREKLKAKLLNIKEFSEEYSFKYLLTISCPENDYLLGEIIRLKNKRDLAKEIINRKKYDFENTEIQNSFSEEDGLIFKQLISKYTAIYRRSEKKDSFGY